MSANSCSSALQVTRCLYCVVDGLERRMSHHLWWHDIPLPTLAHQNAIKRP
jgi:hypothetical protein